MNDPQAALTRAQFSNARFFHFAEKKSIPALRVAGLARARGDIVALTEDHCLFHEQWATNVLRAHAAPELVIGGAVENAATDRLVDWAVFFCEYGRYMLPSIAGETTSLPGSNVTYKRAALDKYRDVFAAPTWEFFWHARLLRAGVALFNDPRLIVYHRKNFTLGGFWRERFHYARSFAGERSKHTTWVRRALYVGGAPFLSPLLVWRSAATVWRKRRQRRELILALPYIFLFTLAWSLGEWIGYVAGQGASLAKVE